MVTYFVLFSLNHPCHMLTCSFGPTLCGVDLFACLLASLLHTSLLTTCSQIILEQSARHDWESGLHGWCSDDLHWTLLIVHNCPLATSSCYQREQLHATADLNLVKDIDSIVIIACIDVTSILIKPSK